MLLVMGQYTRRNAARRLGIDEKTLDTWAKRAGVEPSYDQFDSHLRLYSDEQLVQIAEVRANYWLVRGGTPYAPILPTPISKPMIAPAASESKHSASQGYSGGSTLPDGWITYKQMCLRHGISERAADKQLGKAFKIHRDTTYQVNGVEVIRVMDPEQQAAFLEWLQRRRGD